MKKEKDCGGFGRRDFVKLCVGAMAAGAQSVSFAKHARPRSYRRSLLVDDRDQPLRVRDIVVGENYVFHYPYISTPCFLLNVDEPVVGTRALFTQDGQEYEWRGGAGPDQSIVAFSAICAHKMTHPAKSVSFINYRHERVKFQNHQETDQEGSKVIFCCSERSVYDVRDGARVLGGPAKQPLAAIMLEYDPETDALFAVGTYGGEMFDQFFAKFTTRLQLEYRTTDIQRQVGEQTQVLPLDEYCKTRILC